MIAKPTARRLLPDCDAPVVQEPVNATFLGDVYYVTERGPVLWPHPFYCARVFAYSVLDAIDRIMAGERCAMAHIGCYNPRLARKRNGDLIQPKRWSNHAYGEAIDFRGVVSEEGVYIPYRMMEKRLTEELKTACAEKIAAVGRKAEIVDEGDWLHLGIWPERRGNQNG